MDSKAAVNPDIALFDLVYNLLEATKCEPSGERRSGDRRPYRCVQLLAPLDGQTMPGPTEFFCIECYDLSPQGFSFYLDHDPKYRQVIVALGKVPFTFVVAEVVRRQPHEGSWPSRYLVGCRFLRRIG